MFWRLKIFLKCNNEIFTNSLIHVCTILFLQIQAFKPKKTETEAILISPKIKKKHVFPEG